MNRVSSVALVVLLAGLVGFGQTASSGPTPAQAVTPKAIGHGSFPVKVTKTLNSEKLREGDGIEVETAGSFKLADGTLVSKGAKLTGHVVASKARAKGDAESELAVVFDKLNVANGKQLVVKGSIQAVFPPLPMIRIQRSQSQPCPKPAVRDISPQISRAVLTWRCPTTRRLSWIRNR
jgi:hypothetical protein